MEGAEVAEVSGKNSAFIRNRWKKDRGRRHRQISDNIISHSCR